MGKYNQSELHNWYSDWHIQIEKPLYMTDLDVTLVAGDGHKGELKRLWCELDEGCVVAIVDIKTNMDKATWTEGIAYDDIEINWGKPVFIVTVVNPRRVEEKCLCDGFYVERWGKDGEEFFTERGFAEWLEALR